MSNIISFENANKNAYQIFKLMNQNEPEDNLRNQRSIKSYFDHIYI